MRRRFGRRERASLYLASGGHCAGCGARLARGWHADHVIPWSAGGPTDVINGQALCPACNLKKGNRMNNLRDWQRQAIERFETAGRPQDFTVTATPGAGKTVFALTLARRLLDNGTIKRIAVIVPTDALRTQWASQGMVRLMPVGEPADYDRSDVEGFVVSYQQLLYGGAGMDLCRRATGVPTLAILDEVHHAGDNRSWGDGLKHALDRAVHRIALTGTPWRRDPRSPIPFVRYDDSGRVIVDYAYEYGQAVADSVCRPIEFHAYDGEAKWKECGGAEKSTALSGDLTDEDSSAAMDAALHPDHQWMRGLLSRANAALDDARDDVPDAGGLVVAQDQWRANAYANLLREITGKRPVVVVSDDPDAKANIERFRSGTSKWIVAVKMVSEGVDIPRLLVGVYAAKTKTPLFFRQVVGRFVRVRNGEEVNARLFLPAVDSLMGLAADIENELRHQLEVVAERERERRESDGQQQLDLRETLSASDPVFDCAILGGDSISAQEYADAERHCKSQGIPAQYAAGIARILRQQPAPITPPVAQVQPVPEEPYHVRLKLMRQEVEKLVRRLAYKTGVEPREVNTDLRRQGWPKRAEATIDQLESMKADLERWIGAA